MYGGSPAVRFHLLWTSHNSFRGGEPLFLIILDAVDSKKSAFFVAEPGLGEASMPGIWHVLAAVIGSTFIGQDLERLMARTTARPGNDPD